MTPKLSKADPSVEYNPHGGTLFKRCGRCSMYVDYGGCTLVRGFIDSHDGICKRFEKSPERKAAA